MRASVKIAARRHRRFAFTYSKSEKDRRAEIADCLLPSSNPKSGNFSPKRESKEAEKRFARPLNFSGNSNGDSESRDLSPSAEANRDSRAPTNRASLNASRLAYPSVYIRLRCIAACV